MWRNMGVRRDAEGLAEALESINHWCRYVLPRQFADPTGWELQNMLCVGRLMIEAAIAAAGNPRRALPHRFSRRPTTSIGTGTLRFGGNNRKEMCLSCGPFLLYNIDSVFPSGRFWVVDMTNVRNESF